MRKGNKKIIYDHKKEKMKIKFPRSSPSPSRLVQPKFFSSFIHYTAAVLIICTLVMIKKYGKKKKTKIKNKETSLASMRYMFGQQPAREGRDGGKPVCYLSGRA